MMPFALILKIQPLITSLTIPVLSGFIIFKFSCLLTCVKHLRRACLNRLQEAAGSKQLQEAGVRINLHF